MLRPVVTICLLALCAPAMAQPDAFDLRAALRARAVTDDDFVRHDLFTWTTESQAAVLTAGGALLWAEATDGAEVSPYQRALSRDAAASPVLAVLIDHPALQRRRYAWVTP